MDSLKTQIETGRLCRSLRTKTMFYQTAETEALTPDKAGPCWCARTQTIHGPDDKLVGPEECRPGRSCCETA